MGLIKYFKEAITQIEENNKDKQELIYHSFCEGYTWGFLKGSKFIFVTTKSKNKLVEEGIKLCAMDKKRIKMIRKEEIKRRIKRIREREIKRRIIDEKLRRDNKEGDIGERIKYENDPGIEIEAEIAAENDPGIEIEAEIASDFSSGEEETQYNNYHISNTTKKEMNKRFKENKEKVTLSNAAEFGERLGLKDGEKFYERFN